MAGEKEVAEATAKTAADVIMKVFGGGSESVIAILILVVLLCLLAVWFMFKKLNDRDHLVSKLLTDITDVQRQHNQDIMELTDKYTHSVEAINKQAADDAKTSTEAINGMRVMMAEMKTLLSIMFNQHPRS